MNSERLKPLKVEAISNGSKRLIDALKVITTNTKFISLSSPVQTEVLTILRRDIVPLALPANTLKYGLPTIFHSKDGSKKSIHVHKAIARYMLERFKQISMWSDDRQMVVRSPSDLRQISVRCPSNDPPCSF
jgi:hypothetical protein